MKCAADECGWVDIEFGKLMDSFPRVANHFLGILLEDMDIPSAEEYRKRLDGLQKDSRHVHPRIRMIADLCPPPVKRGGRDR
jgi:hypothetical protein